MHTVGKCVALIPSSGPELQQLGEGGPFPCQVSLGEVTSKWHVLAIPKYLLIVRQLLGPVSSY